MNNGKFKEYNKEIEIKDDKIYLSLNKNKDYVEIYRELYPN